MPHIIDPQQELFSRIKMDAEAMDYDVYDGFLPPLDTPYPLCIWEIISKQTRTPKTL